MYMFNKQHRILNGDKISSRMCETHLRVATVFSRNCDHNREVGVVILRLSHVRTHDVVNTTNLPRFLVGLKISTNQFQFETCG